MRNLVYFASGGYVKEEYNNLPLEKIYLFDKAGLHGQRLYRPDGRLSSHLDLEKKVINIRSECNIAISWLTDNNIIIDALVIINDGLIEGGGDYVFFGKSFFSRLYPLINNETILITSLNYHSCYKRLLDGLPIELEPIDNSSFTSFNHRKYTPDVFRLKKKEIIINEYKENNKLIKEFRNQSIWEDRDKLDAIFINITNQIHIEQLTGVRKEAQNNFVTENSVGNNLFRRLYNNVFIIENSSADSIKETCQNKNFNKIGIMDCYDQIADPLGRCQKPNAGPLKIKKMINEITTSDTIQQIFIYSL